MYPTVPDIPQEIDFLAGFLLDLLSGLPQSHQPYLLDQLVARFFPHHWYPHQPERASGFRAISHDPARQDGYLDPVLRSFATQANLTPKQLKKALANSHGWTLWCDPGCVSIRYHQSGGEIRELWGNLPHHLAPLRAHSASPQIASTNSPTPQPSPCKSRAIPILAPSTAARFGGVAVIPPTPLPERIKRTGHVEDVEDVELASHMNRPFFIGASHSRQASKHADPDMIQCSASSGGRLSPILSDEDPFLRPASRTSSASSSSGSDHSAFSAISVSTSATTPPATNHVRKVSAGASAPPPHAQQIFVRHHSTSSLSYCLPTAQVSQFPNRPYAFPAHAPTGLVAQTMISRSSSPAGGVATRRLRERHYSSASISSVASTGSTTRHGGLVLKEGPGTVTEHSGGKVGVMGGGVLLGLPKTEGANPDKMKNAGSLPNRRNGRRARSSQHQFSVSSFTHFQ